MLNLIRWLSECDSLAESECDSLTESECDSLAESGCDSLAESECDSLAESDSLFESLFLQLKASLFDAAGGLDTSVSCSVS